ncbi:MAG: FecR family protein [Devosia sp.]
MMMKRALVAGALALALALSSGAAYASASGTALGLKPYAEADTGGETRVLTVGADIFVGDLLRTGPKGNVQIKFADQTELVVGPNSTLRIEEYLLRTDGLVKSFAVDALEGTFRFATGLSPKDAYKITTPTGTIGVRGTGIDFTVEKAITKVLLYYGAVELCDWGKQCVVLDGFCEIGTIDLTEAEIIGWSSDTKGAERTAWKRDFIYAQNQRPLLREFWFFRARECFNKPFVHPYPDREPSPWRDRAPPPRDCPQVSRNEMIADDLAGYAYPISDVAFVAVPVDPNCPTPQ